MASQRSTALAKLAQMYVDDGNLAAAQQAIDQGLGLDPESTELQRAQLAVKAAVAGQTEEEAEHLDTLLLEPEPEPGEGLGRILTLIGCENLRRRCTARDVRRMRCGGSTGAVLDAFGRRERRSI